MSNFSSSFTEEIFKSVGFFFRLYHVSLIILSSHKRIRFFTPSLIKKLPVGYASSADGTDAKNCWQNITDYESVRPFGNF